ncbi:hypothetical protein [Myxococcus fulvus]|uniref:hypothetical protein n=1 Tax=Myxococcus fulvus TaxID=33 RepID=UPI0020C0296A|nr:hypothetical protein [Myxococcus fulvus]MCK8497526.1 hypothetical protein [Myxococcus fulvus]
MKTQARLLSLALLALAAACSSKGDDQEDAGTVAVVDVCNSREEALTLDECELKPGETLERFLAKEGPQREGDQDWYRIVLPANTTARTLLNLNGVYVASSTAVQLSLTVLETLPDGKEAALAKKDDKHGQGAPKPVDMVLPLRADLAGKTLLVLVQDSPDVVSQPKFDARSPYRLTARITENPDTNEPNDAMAAATPVALTSAGGVLTGTATGYLATDNDVDRFTFDVPQGKVLYVGLTAPDQGFVPNWRLSYQLLRPGFLVKEEKEDEDQVRPSVRPGVLATARKVKEAKYGGKWMLVVRGYRGISDRDTASGDIQQAYQVDVRVLDEADAQDSRVVDGVVVGNDKVADALARGLTAPAQDLATTIPSGATTTFTGRLGYIGDEDWYEVRLPATAAPTRLHYHLVPKSEGGRFPPLPDIPDRQVLVFTLVSKGATIEDWRTACVNDSTECPKGYGENPDIAPLVQDYCRRTDLPAPMCLHSLREEVSENPRFVNLSNFRGVIPVPAFTGEKRYLFNVQDNGVGWADDKDYDLVVTWREEDADEQGRYSGGVEQVVTKAMASTTAFPAPPDTAEYSVSGRLSHGYGRLRSGDDRVNGRGVRGPMDYDAVPSDVDSYLFTLPAVPAPEDRAWLVQWEVAKSPDGGTAHGLALDLTFCDGDAPATPDAGIENCAVVRAGSRNQGLTLGYRSDALRAWHTPAGASVSTLQPLYTLEERPNSTVVTLAPYACGCLEGRFVRGGKMRVDVSASERNSYEQVGYTLRTGYADYPQSYTRDGGVTTQCPGPADAGTDPDGGVAPLSGGCVFTRQP